MEKTVTQKKNSRIKWFVGLHLLLLFYSFGGYFSKHAAGAAFLSGEYLMNYAAVLGILVIYAVFWQIILKKLPLTIAMANKSVTVIWGILYGAAFFGEKITVQNLAGALIIMAGIYLVTAGEQEETK